MVVVAASLHQVDAVAAVAAAQVLLAALHQVEPERKVLHQAAYRAAQVSTALRQPQAFGHPILSLRALSQGGVQAAG